MKIITTALYTFLIFLLSACTNQKELCNKTYEAESFVEFCNVALPYSIIKSNENPNAPKLGLGLLTVICLNDGYEQKKKCDEKSEYIPALNW